MHTAKAASAGAQRGHSRRTSSPRPKHRRQSPLEEPSVGGPPLFDCLPLLGRHGRRLPSVVT